jgi:histidinol-phosphate phosphatase family protein
MKRALFIDRDGTINVDCPYCSKPEDIKMYVDAIDLIKSYRKFGYLVIVITNQSGIGRKFFSEKELVEFNDSLNMGLRKFGASVDRF